MQSVGVFLTMDCEPTIETSHPTATGPRDWAHGERAVRGYWEIGRAHGFPVTFFVHPETAIAQAPLFRELEAEGACIGLHMHPWKFSVWKHGGKRYLGHYGGLSADQQRALLIESSAIWAEAIGHRPLYFRPGTFSANDSIFAVLAEQGFRGGSCSAPGRMLPEMRAIWTGAEPDPHRANAEFRQVAGTLDFAEAPLSMDFSRLLEGRIGRRMHPDLRPDIDWPGQYGTSWRSIATNILAQVMDRQPRVPIMGMITHNQYEYFDPAEPARQRMLAMLAELVRACEQAGVAARGTTLIQISDAVLAEPAIAEPLVVEGAVFESQGEVPTL
jgi:hypothetical protein